MSKKLTNLYKQATKLFPGVDLDTNDCAQWENDTIEVCGCEEACACEELAQLPWGRHVVNTSAYQELEPIPLPSSFDKLPDGWSSLARKEEKLRVAQAEEALEALRGHIAHKSFLYRENTNWATGKRGRTKSYDEINEVEQKMRSKIKVYESAIWALARLGVAHKYPRFQKITRADTKAVTAVFDPNRRGQRNEGLSWIWQVMVDGKQDKKGYVRERQCFRRFCISWDVRLTSFI